MSAAVFRPCAIFLRAVALGVVTTGALWAPAWAGDLEVVVRTPAGAAVADAVVTVDAAEHRAPPARFAQPLAVTQRNRQFDPFVLLAPVGADVRFPNEDDVRHQVYSFSPAKSFELRLYGKDQSRVVHFDKPGVVSLGCNIHDQMLAYIVVVDTAFAAKTDASGRAVVHGLPAGSATVRVWRPFMKGPDNTQVFQATLPATGLVSRAVVAEIRIPPMRMNSY